MGGTPSGGHLGNQGQPGGAQNREDNTKDAAERPQNDDDLKEADSKSDKTAEQRPRNGRRVTADFLKNEKTQKKVDKKAAVLTTK